MVGVTDGNIGFYGYAHVQTGGVAWGICRRLGYHIVMAGSNLDGLLEHIISNRERFGYWPHTPHILNFIAHIR